MLICFSTEGKEFDSPLSTHFEKAKWFLFFDTETHEIQSLEHKRRLFGRSQAVHLVTEKRPFLVITGNIEPNSFDFFKASGIKIISGVFTLTAREAWQRYQQGLIQTVEDVPGAGRGRVL